MGKELQHAENSNLAGADKNVHSLGRNDYMCGYRPRRLDTRMGAMYLMVPRLRNSGYIPFFVSPLESEAVGVFPNLCSSN